MFIVYMLNFTTIVCFVTIYHFVEMKKTRQVTFLLKQFLVTLYLSQHSHKRPKHSHENVKLIIEFRGIFRIITNFLFLQKLKNQIFLIRVKD